jgi:competence protein ComGC
MCLLAAILVPNFIKARSRGQLTACKSNLKNIGTALEMFATDHDGEFPATMVMLTPRYLRVVPECPHASEDTYSPSYQRGERTYTFYCSGLHHKAAGITAANYPQYNSTQGLIERP